MSPATVAFAIALLLTAVSVVVAWTAEMVGDRKVVATGEPPGWVDVVVNLAIVGMVTAATVAFFGSIVLLKQARCNAIGNHSAVDSVNYDLFGGCFVNIDGLVMPDDVWREVLLTERTP